jgi:predicted secreted protein
MKIRYLFAAAAAISLLTISACSSTPKQVSLNESASGSQVEIANGGTVTISLDSNTESGYSWVLTGAPDTAILNMTDSSYHSILGQYGEQGKQMWVFSAEQPGITTISIDYGLPNNTQKIIKSFTVTVEVK